MTQAWTLVVFTPKALRNAAQGCGVAIGDAATLGNRWRVSTQKGLRIAVHGCRIAPGDAPTLGIKAAHFYPEGFASIPFDHRDLEF